jgi:hypothetical protein
MNTEGNGFVWIENFHSLEDMILKIKDAMRTDDPVYVTQMIIPPKRGSSSDIPLVLMTIVLRVQFIVGGSLWMTTLKIGRYQEINGEFFGDKAKQIYEACKGVDDLIISMLYRDGFTNIRRSYISLPENFEFLYGESSRLKWNDEDFKYELNYLPLDVHAYRDERQKKLEEIRAAAQKAEEENFNRNMNKPVEIGKL